jgi:hypothetical protein
LDPKKIQAMQEWPRNTILKCLRGFLGLTGYYKKCFHHYGKISNPLTNLLKRNAFHWTLDDEQAFTELKRDMCTTPILASLDFNKTFMVDLYASRSSIGTVLTEDGQPLVFTCQALSGCNMAIYTYEK